MATIVLVGGAGASPDHWRLVAGPLAAAGHEVVCPHLPCDDDAAGLDRYAGAVADACPDDGSAVLVAHSMGALSAPRVARMRPLAAILLVAAMIPAPGETGAGWWWRSGWEGAFRASGRDPLVHHDPAELFFHDVPPDVAVADAAVRRRQSRRPFTDVALTGRWPEVRTAALACTEDRLFPPAFMERLARARIGITPDRLACGHVPALARPDALASWIDRTTRAPDVMFR